MIDIRHCRLIQAVAEEGNLTKAGQRLFLTQSALSHQLKEVEKDLGTPIFRRSRKRMMLTPVGQRILESANRILTELEHTEADIRNYIHGEHGTIRISTECYTCYHWLPSLLKKYQKKFPHVDITIVPEATSNPLPFLLEGKLDVAIVIDPETKNSSARFHPLFEDEVVAVVARHHPFARKACLTAVDFASETWFYHRKPADDSALFRHVLKPAGLRPKRIVEVALTEAMVEMVDAGMGIATMARWAVRPYLASKSLKCIPLRDSRGLHRTWYAATSGNEDSAFLRYFLTTLARYPKSL